MAVNEQLEYRKPLLSDFVVQLVLLVVALGRDSSGPQRIVYRIADDPALRQHEYVARLAPAIVDLVVHKRCYSGSLVRHVFKLQNVDLARPFRRDRNQLPRLAVLVVRDQ